MVRLDAGLFGQLAQRGVAQPLVLQMPAGVSQRPRATCLMNRTRPSRSVRIAPAVT